MIFSHLVHDKSCFRSGETTAKRWIYSEETTPFLARDVADHLCYRTS